MNQQPTLWDSTVFCLASERMEREAEAKRARDCDPVTSQESAEQISTKLTLLQSRMLAAFSLPRTANEAARACVDQHGEHDQDTYRKRKHELQRKGLIECVGRRKCFDKGGSAEVFRRVDRC